MKEHDLLYWHEALRHPEVEGTHVPVRYDPFNVGLAYAYVRGQWVRCLSQYYAAFQGHSEQALAGATEILRQQARVPHQAASITPRRLADFLAHVQAHERVLVPRLRDQEARGVLECIGAGGEARPPDTREPTPPEALSWEAVDLARLPVYEEYRYMMDQPVPAREPFAWLAPEDQARLAAFKADAVNHARLDEVDMPLTQAILEPAGFAHV